MYSFLENRYDEKRVSIFRKFLIFQVEIDGNAGFRPKWKRPKRGMAKNTTIFHCRNAQLFIHNVDVVMVYAI